jgi:hypothetical protein
MITFDQFETEVRRIVAENFHYLYARPPQGCVYLLPKGEGWEGSCLFGHVFLALGLSTDEIRQFEGDTVVALISKFIPGTTREQKFWAVEIQGKQDNGYTWGQALAYADEQFPLRGEA